MIIKFGSADLERLWKPREDSRGEENGQITIIGGSKLFHGAPLLAIKPASRLVDMVFFSSPEAELEKISAKAALSSFIWVPWGEVEEYIKKSEAVLVGPGMMRFRDESRRADEQEITGKNKIYDEAGTETRSITKYFLQKFADKRWVVDGGSLQVMKTEWIPRQAILTPNAKEYELLFNERFTMNNLQSNAKMYNCVITYKGPVSYVADGEVMYEIRGGNAGLTKGGTGDVLAGVTAGLAAKNPPLLAAAAASYIVKKTAESLYQETGYNFNADDLAEKVFGTMRGMTVT
jgi:hydroxyethylthiazole kinase-like uncharacterized protein yjeF